MKYKSYLIKDIIQLNYGKSLPKSKRTEGDFPVYGSGGITGFHNDFLVEGPSIIIGRKGTVGSLFYEDRNFFPIDTTYYVLPSTEYDLKYLYYLFQTIGLEQMNTHSAVPGLNRDGVYAKSILLPPISYQKRVSDFMSLLEKKIELNNQMIDTLEEIASTLFKRWFVDFEFPDENGNPYKSSGGKMIDSELGEIPEGWRIVALKDVFHQKKENFNPSKYPNREVMHFSMPSFDKSKLPIIDNTNYIKSNKNIVGENSVLFSKMNPETKRVWLPNFTENSFNVSSTEFIVVDSNEEDKMFLYTLLLSLDFQNYLVTNATGSTGSRQRIRPSTAMNYSFAYSEEMKRKANLIIGGFSEKIINLRKEIQTLEDVRDSLLPKLLSGEIEL